LESIKRLLHLTSRRFDVRCTFMISDPPNGREDREDERRRLAERLLPELVKRLIEAGVGRLAEGPENLRHFVGELRLPKEIGNYLLSQIDETKNGLYRVVAKEIRDFLENTSVADEFSSALSKLSLEIKTEIRFVPNDAAEHGAPTKPQVVRTEVAVSTGRAQGDEEPRPRKRGR
jgi:hypothetical protein